jgi:hypothetical protein
MSYAHAIFQIDAFTTAGSQEIPPRVIPMDRFRTMHVQAVAAENNLAETAFWFRRRRLSPALVHAHRRGAALWSCHPGERSGGLVALEPGRDKVMFHTASGPLTVNRKMGLRHGLPGAAVRTGRDTTTPASPKH